MTEGARVHQVACRTAPVVSSDLGCKRGLDRRGHPAGDATRLHKIWLRRPRPQVTNTAGMHPTPIVYTVHIHVHVHINIVHVVAIHHLGGVCEGRFRCLRGWGCILGCVQHAELIGVLRVRVVGCDGMRGFWHIERHVVGQRAIVVEGGWEGQSLRRRGCAEGEGLQAFLWHRHVSQRDRHGGCISSASSQRTYIAMFCEALGASYSYVDVAVVVPTPLLRRDSPILRIHVWRGREVCQSIPKRQRQRYAG